MYLIECSEIIINYTPILYFIGYISNGVYQSISYYFQGVEIELKVHLRSKVKKSNEK